MSYENVSVREEGDIVVLRDENEAIVASASKEELVKLLVAIDDVRRFERTYPDLYRTVVDTLKRSPDAVPAAAVMEIRKVTGDFIVDCRKIYDKIKKYLEIDK